MKYRQKIISEYKLLGTKKFILKMKKNEMNRIAVSYSDSICLNEAADIFSSKLVDYYYTDKTKRASPIKGDEGKIIGCLEPDWIVLIYSYLLRNTRVIDKYIWID